MGAATDLLQPDAPRGPPQTEPWTGLRAQLSSTRGSFGTPSSLQKALPELASTTTLLIEQPKSTASPDLLPQEGGSRYAAFGGYSPSTSTSPASCRPDPMLIE